MKTTEIVEGMEREAVSGSKVLSQLVETYSKVDTYLSSLDGLRSFVQRKGLFEQALEIFEEHSSQGVIYVLLGEDFERMNQEISPQLLNLLSGEVLGEGGQSHSKWKEFIQRYETAMFRSYQDFLRTHGKAAVIFEASCRQIFEDGFRAWYKEAPSEVGEKLSELTKRFSKALSGLFHHLRERISATLRFDDSLIVESLGKALIVPGPLSELNLQILEPSIEERGLTLSLFDKMNLVISSSLREWDEKDIVDRFKDSPITGRADITRLLPQHPVEVSAGGLSALKNILAEKGQELKTRVHRELQETEKALDSRRKELVGGMQESWNGLKALSQRIFSSEDYTALSEEMREKMGILERFLGRSLWSLKQLRRKKSELERTIRRGEGLVDLTETDIEELLREGRESEGPVYRLYETYRSLQRDRVGELNDRPKRELNRLIREEEKNAKEWKTTQMLEGITRRHRLLKKTYDLDELLKRYLLVMSEVIEPLVISKRIEDMIKVWPPKVKNADEIEGSTLLEEARYVGETLAVRGSLYQLSAGKDTQWDLLPSSEAGDLSRIVEENCAQVVSLLVYDIRGSTFMGKKLRDAKTESEIRNRFNQRMVELGRRQGGFPIKDTGDGGILLFAANSDELCRDCFAPREEDEEAVRQAVPLKEKPAILPSTQSAERAISCALHMVREAQTFVEENISRYADWFKEVEERPLFYEGISYANLPPEYQTIFQIGIGVASGLPDRDVFFGPNSFGDIDVTGNLVRDANLYSKAKTRKGSMVLCDGHTVLNFLLNVEEFEPHRPQITEIERLAAGKRGTALREEAKRWWELSGRRGEYRFSNLGAVIRRVGLEAVLGKEAVEETPLAAEAKGVKIDEYGKLRDEKGREVKILYEVGSEQL